MKLFTTTLIAALTATVAAQSFASYTLQNESPSKELVIAYGFKGGIQIPYGESHTFDSGSGNSVVAHGQVLFDIILTDTGLEVNPRDPYDGSKYKVVVWVNPREVKDL